VEGLRTAITDSLDLLASPEGALIKPLFTRDPTGEMLTISRGSRTGARSAHHPRGVELARWRRALLMVQVRAAGSDTDAQQAACQAIRGHSPRAWRRSRRPTGGGSDCDERTAGVRVASRATIKSEVMRLSA